MIAVRAHELVRGDIVRVDRQITKYRFLHVVTKDSGARWATVFGPVVRDRHGSWRNGTRAKLRSFAPERLTLVSRPPAGGRGSAPENGASNVAGLVRGTRAGGAP